MNALKKLLLFSSISIVILAIVGCEGVSATNFYVSNAGNDNAAGTSPETAWKTVAKVNSQSFSAGDSIFFRSGDVWREELVLRNSGEKDNHIVYTSYGEGVKPKFLGSTQAVDWTEVSPNIWRSSTNVDNPDRTYPGNVFFEKNDGSTHWGRVQKAYDASFSELETEFDYCWNSNNIYIYSTSNPTEKYAAVEVSQRDHCIRLENPVPDYVSIDGFIIRYAIRRALFGGYPVQEASGLHITRCEIAYVGVKDGSSAYGIFMFHSNSLVRHNEIHDCGRRGISFSEYENRGVTFENVIIEKNVFYNGFHTTSIDFQILGDSEAGDTARNFYFRNNLVYNDTAATLLDPEGKTSNDIFFQGEGQNGAYINNIYIYNNIVMNSKARSILVRYGDTVHIYNNTIYGHNRRAVPYALVSIYGTKTVFYENNITYGTLRNSQANDFGILVEEPVTKFATRDHNLYYYEDPNQWFMYVPREGATQTVAYRMGEWSKYLSENPSYDQNSPQPADPLFMNPHHDLRLTENSPARGMGRKIPFINADFYGTPLNDPPDIGALAYGTEPPIAVPLSESNGAKESILIYPNPANRNLSVAVNGLDPALGYVIRMFDIQGKMVFESEHQTGSEINLPLAENIRRGIYMLELAFDNSRKLTEKFIVTR